MTNIILLISINYARATRKIFAQKREKAHKNSWTIFNFLALFIIYFLSFYCIAAVLVEEGKKIESHGLRFMISSLRYIDKKERMKILKCIQILSRNE